jgi:hypothetical protein
MAALPAPTHLTVEGKTHKITVSQWSLLVRAVREGNLTPGVEVGRLEVVRQLQKKGFCGSSDHTYQRYEWNRPVATLHSCRPYPAVAAAVKALIAERAAQQAAAQ